MAQMKLSDLILDDRCQMRVAASEKYAQQLADFLEAGGSLPPLIGFRERPQRPGPAWLADGWHRRRAREILHQVYAEVDVRAGGLREASIYATGCNAKNPLHMEPEDQRKAVLTLLRDPEWSRKSNREIMRQVGCGWRRVGEVREYLAENPELSVPQAQIEREGVTVQRGGSTYVMKFRDMTPAAQAAAVGAESDRCRPAWAREGREAGETLVRCLACLGTDYEPLRLEAQATLRGLERRWDAERKGGAPC